MELVLSNEQMKSPRQATEHHEKSQEGADFGGTEQ